MSMDHVNSGLNSGLKPTVQEIRKPFHITWVTHNSRISERMIKYKVKKGDPLIFTDKQEVEITSYINQIVKELDLIVLAYNICGDHVHIILLCDENNLSNIVRTLKSKSTYLYKKNHSITGVFNLWARKYNTSYIDNNQKKLINTISYVNNNREKHGLVSNIELNEVIKYILTKETLF